MSGKSVSRGKMLVFQTVLLISLLIHCLCGEESLNYNRVDCKHTHDTKCVIEAVFGNTLTNDSVEAYVSCSNQDELSRNQFSKVDKIVWNGCQTPWNLKSLGLQKISWRNQVKHLKIEYFASGALELETFDGFLGLEVLSIQHNSIQNLSSSCFRGMKNLKALQMIENDLKWMDMGLLSDLPKLNTLEIHDSQHSLNHQFTENQIVNTVVLDIYYIAMDLLEHLFLHVRHLSILLKPNDDAYGCEQTRHNGYERNWIVEELKLENFKCGFIMENVKSIKSLELIRVIQMSYSEFELRNLENLEEISLHQNAFKNFHFFNFGGNFNNLKLLDFSSNNLTEIDMRGFETFTNLRKINLDENFLSKLDEMNLEKFRNVKLFVNGNNFDCSWLDAIASSELFLNFVYEQNVKSLNINGLSCQHNQRSPEYISTNETLCSSYFIDPVNNEAERELLQQKEVNFMLAPEVLMIIVCAASLLGIAVSFISIYMYRRRQMSKQEPFYHLLRDSLIRPIFDVRSTLRRDFKEMISRNLPPTNYEHPISESNVTEMSDVVTNTNNIYEEIPQKLYQEIV